MAVCYVPLWCTMITYLLADVLIFSFILSPTSYYFLDWMYLNDIVCFTTNALIRLKIGSDTSALIWCKLELGYVINILLFSKEIDQECILKNTLKMTDNINPLVYVPVLIIIITSAFLR